MAKDILAKKETLTMKKDKDVDHDADHAATDDKQPRNLRADVVPTEGFALEVDGKMKSQHVTADEAFKRGLALKTKFPVVQVRVFDAKAQTRTIVEMPKA